MAETKIKDNLEVIKETLAVLETEPNWHLRYADYASKILEHEKHYKEMARKFHVSFPLSAYTSISKLTGSSAIYDIRYIGQSIGTLTIKSDGSRVFKYSEGYSDLRNKRGYSNLPELKKEEKWESAKMSECRSILKSIELSKANTHSPEHKCENLLLREFSKKQSTKKSLLRIQPVRFAGKFVQLTTILKASKKGEVTYSTKGGGIDILARVGVGANSHLCVLELKDENHASEPMAVVLQQALSYAVFLAQLLDNENCKEWWKVLGYKGNVEPIHRIDVVGLMPKGDESVCDAVYKVGSFELHLHTLYFDKDALFNQEKFEFSGSYVKELA